MQAGFFDFDERHRKPDERDPLAALQKPTDREGFRRALNNSRARSRKSNAGRRPFRAATTFKALAPRHPRDLSDDELAHRTRDRLSLCRLPGLNPEERTLAAKTIRLLRERRAKAEPTSPLVLDFDPQLGERDAGLGKGGRPTRASSTPRQRNSREQNAMVEAGEVPERSEENANPFGVGSLVSSGSRSRRSPCYILTMRTRPGSRR